jgi:hypothetical protein
MYTLCIYYTLNPDFLVDSGMIASGRLRASTNSVEAYVIFLAQVSG